MSPEEREWILEIVAMSAPRNAGGRGIRPEKMVLKLSWSSGHLWMVEAL